MGKQSTAATTSIRFQQWTGSSKRSNSLCSRANIFCRFDMYKLLSICLSAWILGNAHISNSGRTDCNPLLCYIHMLKFPSISTSSSYAYVQSKYVLAVMKSNIFYLFFHSFIHDCYCYCNRHFLFIWVWFGFVLFFKFLSAKLFLTNDKAHHGADLPIPYIHWQTDAKYHKINSGLNFSLTIH